MQPLWSTIKIDGNICSRNCSSVKVYSGLWLRHCQPCHTNEFERALHGCHSARVMCLCISNCHMPLALFLVRHKIFGLVSHNSWCLFFHFFSRTDRQHVDCVQQATPASGFKSEADVSTCWSHAYSKKFVMDWSRAVFFPRAGNNCVVLIWGGTWPRINQSHCFPDWKINRSSMSHM